MLYKVVFILNLWMKFLSVTIQQQQQQQVFYLHSQLNGIAQEERKGKITTKNIIKRRISPI